MVLSLGREPLTQSGLGRVVEVGDAGAVAFVMAAEATPDLLPRAMYNAHGLLLVRGLGDLVQDPSLLVRISRLFGEEVEDYRTTLTAANQVHQSVPEILVVSNTPPTNRPPPPMPDPPLTADGGLPLQFPHRRGWHSDQSYRRPPPDISLFYAAVPAPKGQGQTLYADGIAAYASLPPPLKDKVETLIGIHAQPRTGRSESAVRKGEVHPVPEPHRAPQRQPVVRVHPVTGEKALFLCEAGQMDWVDGPFVGMSPGPDGEGAALLYEIMHHYTDPRFVYAHEWERGDLIIYDNRCTIHTATWFDADRHGRLMWRTTVRGNPGPEYAGEAPSWIPPAAG
jgi:taurine dioxygenase